MKNNLKNIYHNFVNNNFIKYDEGQVKLLEVFDDIVKNNKKINFFSKLKKFDGIYLYGSVGIGKTFIINLFIQNIKKAKKFHFNHLMINIHGFVNTHRNKEVALEIFIKNIAKSVNIIFIDELHLYNIVDALLIRKIFILFQKYKIFIFISSNFKPIELYKNGLQRNDFLPFIELLKKNFKILHLDNACDYRRQMLNQSKTYFTPINKKTNKEFHKLYERFVYKDEIHIKKIKTKSRLIRFEKCTSNIVFCSFKELCIANLAHEDYRNIARTFSLIFINNVPKFTDSEQDQCRRFISLVDMLYIEKCSVVILADQPINNLCQIHNFKKEFQRTASRLYEMTIINNDTK